jgi:Holliday junction resolvasome RuvABC ATP-dependent DNA helicase subunit
MAELDEILLERGKQYGEFKDHATISQLIKMDMRYGNWHKLEPYKKEALEMIAHKIARILNGNSNNKDSWDDIAGYAKLVSDRLEFE